MSGWTTSLLDGFGELLAAAGVGEWLTDADQVYSPGAVGIVTGLMPATPERVIVMTGYPVSANPHLTNVVQGLNFRFRGTVDPGSVTDLDDAVFDALHGASNLVVGGVSVNQVLFQSAAPMGTDDRDRYLRTANYYVDAERPTAWRTE